MPSKKAAEGARHGRLVFRGGRWMDANTTDTEPTVRQPTMAYDQAMKLRAERKLERAVLTEQGWVTP